MNRATFSKLAGEYPGMLLLFELFNEGGYFGAYGEDAELLARLEVNYMRMDCTEDGLPIVMLSGIDLDDVVHAVLKSGRRVAILEQVGD